YAPAGDTPGERGAQGGPGGVLPGARRLRPLPDLRPGRPAGRRAPHGAGRRRGTGLHDGTAAGCRRRSGRMGQPARELSFMSQLDPVTLGVIWGGLQSITVEVGTTVHRTAHSQQAREGQDFSVCLFDPEGLMIAQGPYSPGHMGAMSFAARNAIAAFPGNRLAAGDVVLFNSPFLGSGHFPDFFMIQPAFHADGRLIGFAANILHHTDVGGMRPGSQAVEGVFDYFQEGLHVPPVKPWEGGEEQEDLLTVILANTRTSESMLGDLRAQRSSLRVGELRMIELTRRYGHETVQAAMIENMDRTERKVREAIRSIPEGVYAFEDYMDDCGPGTDPMRLALTVTVRGDEI